MDKKTQRLVQRETAINREMKLSGTYDRFGILYEDVPDEDVSISIAKKTIKPKKKMTYIAFVSHILLRWYRDPELLRHKNPVSLDGISIKLEKGWKLQDKKNIFLPTEVMNMNMNKNLKDEFGI